MTSEERIALKITAAAAIMKVSKGEAAKRLDESLGPQWRERLKIPVRENGSTNTDGETNKSSAEEGQG